MEIISDEPFYIRDKVYFHSDTHINLTATDVKEILAAMIKFILETIDVFQQAGSGWHFKEVVSLENHTVDYKPIRGSSCIPLPDFIMRKNAIVNIRNTDENVFFGVSLDIFIQERRMI